MRPVCTGDFSNIRFGSPLPSRVSVACNVTFLQKYEKASETELRLWFHLLRSWYRDIMWIQQGGATEKMTHLPLREVAQKRAQQLSLKRIIWRIKALQNAEIHIFNRMGSQKRLILEALIFYLSGADRTLNEALCF